MTANARSQLFTLTAALLGGALAAGIQATAGAAWVLRAGTLIYLAAMFLALRLPEQVDSPPAPPPPRLRPRPARCQILSRTGAGDTPRPTAPTGGWPDPAGTAVPSRSRRTPSRQAPSRQAQGRQAQCRRAHAARRRYARPLAALGRTRQRAARRWRGLASVGPVVGEAMRGNAVLRAFSGYMVFFLAFYLRSAHFGVSHNFALGGLVAAAAAGGLAAMAIGSLIRARAPVLILFAMLTLAPIVTAVCAWFFSLEAAIAVAFTAALAAGLAKLSLTPPCSARSARRSGRLRSRSPRR